MKSWWKYAIVVVLLVVSGLSFKLLKFKELSDAGVTETDYHPSQSIPRSMFTLSSTAFGMNQMMPSKYTCEGDNINPPLSIANIPDKARSLALIMYDPDISDSVKKSYGISEFNHWVAFNMLSTTHMIEEGEDAPGTLGMNGAGKKGYTGPCPPDTEHRYFFELYALDTMLELKAGATREEVEKAMVGHIVAKAELIGTYNKIANR